MTPQTDEAGQVLNKKYSYDAMGNRIAVSSDGERTDYSVNDLNQITQLASSGNVTVITYDANGNMTAIGDKQLEYDYTDRLISVIVPEQKKSEFVYDFEGRKRISRKYSWVDGEWELSDETRFVYDGMDMIQERDAEGNVKSSYIRDGNIGGILAMVNADGAFCYHYDGIGNVVALTDEQQNIVAQYDYDAFGNLLSMSGPQAEKNPFRFSTKYYDADTGLYDFGYRHYDPQLGRWISRDPIGEAGGINLYGFVGNSPTNNIDAYGYSGALYAAAGFLGAAGAGILAWQASDWDSNRLTVAQRKLVDTELAMMKSAAQQLGDRSILRYLNSMNVVGIFRHRNTPADSDSLSRPPNCVRRTRTNLSADFFNRPMWSQMRSLLHESYHTGTGTYEPADDNGDAERWASAALQKLAPHLNKKYGVVFPQSGGYPSPRGRWIPKGIGPL